MNRGFVNITCILELEKLFNKKLHLKKKREIFKYFSLLKSARVVSTYSMPE
jgi:hypothetical protein